MAGRKLTINEIQFAKELYGDSIKYNQVLIFDEKYAFFQPDNSGMTPNGNIYIHGVTSKDFGLKTTRGVLKSFFIHEMGHVWQKQNNILNPIVSAIANSIRNGFFYGESYKYQLNENADLMDYRMEQQAQIIEDCTRVAKLGLLPSPKFLKNNVSGTQLLTLYKSVLSKFIIDPSYPGRVGK
ncbi:hypothetical protein A9Q89_10510 [Gammaproteobacteria bacterium 53_120_T64]|nr:hypothetical protein A9Q89_10510 [Gammaproteobacteria bacterium 53_120_T64]